MLSFGGNTPIYVADKDGGESVQNKSYVRLERDLFEIKTKNGMQYGGNQTLFENPAISAGGCGVIGAANVLCYLKGIQPDESQYNGMCMELYKKYIRVSRRFGITGLGLVYGLNRAFAAYGMAYRAKWCMSMKKLEERIYSMLENDIPVIISAGPALPWRKKSAVTLFCRDGGKLVAKAAMRSHYVTVTAADDKLMCVSSWGKRYYILKSDFYRYVKKHSLPLFCNIVYIERVPVFP